MKKYLSIICVLLTLTAFASCGESSSSSDSSEVPESSISETTTELTTENKTETAPDETATEELTVHTSTEKDDAVKVPDLYGMDFDEAIEKYKDSFVILSDGREESELKQKSIISQNIESGTIYESNGDRLRIHVKLSNGKKATPLHEQILDKTYKSDGISFDYCSEWKEYDSNFWAPAFTIENNFRIITRYQTGEFGGISNEKYIEQKKQEFDEKNRPYEIITNKNGYEIFSYLQTDFIKCFCCANGKAVFTVEFKNYSEEYDDIISKIIDTIEIIPYGMSSPIKVTTEKSNNETSEPIKEFTTEKATEPSVIETANSFEPFTISGTGSTVVRDVNIPAEFVVYSAIHNGTSNFIAHFYDCNDRREFLVNEIGNYSCTQIFDATDIDDSSSGMIEVDADGDWSITFSPIKSVVSGETSTSFSGYGTDITGAFKSTGNMVCNISHDGSSNFIVRAYELTEDGDRQPVVNEIGEYNGQCIIKTKKDVLYLFNVDADGNWTIDVE